MNPENQMSDTPETDAAWNAAPTDDTEFANAGWEFARELERERNRAMEQRLCECSFEDACRFAIERDALRKENRKLREALEDAVWAADYLSEQQDMADNGYQQRLERARKLLNP